MEDKVADVKKRNGELNQEISRQIEQIEQLKNKIMELNQGIDGKTLNIESALDVDNVTLKQKGQTSGEKHVAEQNSTEVSNNDDGCLTTVWSNGIQFYLKQLQKIQA
ncbi:unnamed protein product [Acanthoscelides obtectus]|uniref:Uncharacterized protein n=1 Tax=Acanthoscelides obtectus TaxID=200917 RepID=A0A9P0JLF0_ACAOB|nr:unnamed protein product [Acanthoscelides obtectus]CAK1655005.1 hypothetical protein AOBTE_LOCUS18957 [Acanthoscelides obtectus]